MDEQQAKQREQKQSVPCEDRETEQQARAERFVPIQQQPRKPSEVDVQAFGEEPEQARAEGFVRKRPQPRKRIEVDVQAFGEEPEVEQREEWTTGDEKDGPVDAAPPDRSESNEG